MGLGPNISALPPEVGLLTSLTSLIIGMLYSKGLTCWIVIPIVISSREFQIQAPNHSNLPVTVKRLPVEELKSFAQLTQASPSLQTEVLNSSSMQGEAFEWVVANDSLFCFSPTIGDSRYLRIFFSKCEEHLHDHLDAFCMTSTRHWDFGGTK